VQNFLQSIFFPHLSPFHQPPIILPVLSHLVVGIALSPLDLIRTRLIVQSSISRHRTYTGPLNALSQILRHEGGLRGIYLHPHLFIPTVIDCTLRPLVSLALPGILASYVGAGHISEETHPIAWLMAEFAGSCLGLLITLPFETARRRLQTQVRGTAKPIKACVELRPSPYNGVVDALWHIMTEERSDLPLHSRKRRRATSQAGLKGKEKEKETDVVAVARGNEHESWLRNTGVGQLYRGLGMRLSASVIVLLLGVLTGGQERDSGWAEL
jgi:mitochondrial fusion and transport protein UGO1